MIVGYPLVLYLVYGLLGAFWVRSPLLNEHIHVSSLWVVRRIATPPHDPWASILRRSLHWPHRLAQCAMLVSSDYELILLKFY